MQTNKEHWTKAAFRIYSETKNIEDICAKINTLPTVHHEKGEFLVKGNPKSKVRKENLWILDSVLSDQETLESHIGYFLSFLRENAKGIQELHAECEFDIFCSYSSENGQGGFTLKHETLKELAVYPVDLSIDLYPPEGNGESYAANLMPTSG